MSRDPLEELFGPRDDDGQGRSNDSATPTPAPEPDYFAGLPELPEVPETEILGAPVSAPVAAPVRRSTADDLQTRPVPAGNQGAKRALPWIIVGVVALAMLVGAIFFVNSITAKNAAPEVTSDAPVTEETPSEDTSDAPADEPTDVPTEDPDSEEAPVVDVGSTFSMPIEPAGITVDVSNYLTNVEWFSQAGPPERVLIQSGLMNSFPDSCAAMRSPEGMSPWGLERGADNTWTVFRPAGTCAADPELYDQVWGLMQAMADSATPISESE